MSEVHDRFLLQLQYTSSCEGTVKYMKTSLENPRIREGQARRLVARGSAVSDPRHVAVASMHRIRLPSSRRPLLSPGVLVALASRPPLPASSGRPDVVSDVSVSGVLMSSSTSRCRRVVSAVPGVVPCLDLVPGVSLSPLTSLTSSSSVPILSRRRPGVLVPASSSVPCCIRRLAVVCVVVSASSLVLSSRPSSLPASSPPCRSCRPHGLFFSVGC